MLAGAIQQCDMFLKQLAEKDALMQKNNRILISQLHRRKD